MELSEFAVQAGFTKIENIFCKKIKGYHVTCDNAPMGFVKVPAYLFILKDPISSDIIRKMRKDIGYSRIQKSKEEETMIICYLDKLYASNKVKDMVILKYQNLLEEIISFLIENNIQPQIDCVFCNTNKYEKISDGVYNNIYLPFHQGCYTKHNKNKKEKKEKIENEQLAKEPIGIKALLLTILGAIVGTLPQAFVFVQMHKYISILYITIPIVAGVGYQISDSDTSRTTTTTVIISFIITILFNLFTHSILADVTNIDLFKYIKDNISDLVRSYVMIIFFLILGNIIVHFFIRKLKLKKHRKEK